MSTWLAGVWLDGVWLNGVWLGMGEEPPAPAAGSGGLPPKRVIYFEKAEPEVARESFKDFIARITTADAALVPEEAVVLTAGARQLIIPHEAMAEFALAGIDVVDVALIILIAEELDE